MTSTTITGQGRVSTAFVKWSYDHGIFVDIATHLDCEKNRIPACKILIHAGAKVFADKSLLCPHPYMNDNIAGTFNVLEWARRSTVDLFVYISTHEAIDPISPYAATKKCGEILTEAWWASYKLPYLIVRLPNLFIVDKHDKGYVGGILRGEITEPRDGARVRQWMTADRFAEGLWSLIAFKEYNRIVTLQGIKKSDAEIMEIVKNGEPLNERSHCSSLALP